MIIHPEIAYYKYSGTPVYKCICGLHFTRMDLGHNHYSKGTKDYCPKCKTKFIFKPRCD